MFTQLLHYVQDALNKGDTVPPLLAVIDTEKAALMKSVDVLPFLAKKTIKWGKSASQYTPEALVYCFTLNGTYRASQKRSDKARCAGNGHSLVKHRNAGRAFLSGSLRARP
jgi:hypothetical protein